MADIDAAIDQMVLKQLQARGICSAAVLDAMRSIPRHRFVPDLSIDRAYSDNALPTTAGQTISQPYIVALMSELLDVRPGMKVLEVGTGSGYQTAILAHMGAEVVTIERYPELLELAKAILAEVCPLAPIRMLLSDGTMGHPGEAPYDRILVTAAAPHVPRAYLDQLADPGRIVIPLGDRAAQTLTLVDQVRGKIKETPSVACRFVPLVGADGWDEVEI